MPELSISRKTIGMVILLALIIVLAFFAYKTFNDGRFTPMPTVSVDDTQASAAAIAGTQAFFRVNYQEGKDAWLNRFCTTSTDGGCLFVKSGSASLWKRFEDAKTVTAAIVVPQARVKQTANEQVWKVSVELAEPLPGSEKKSDVAYVVVARVKDTWKIDRFLLDEEIKALDAQSGEGKSQ